MQRQHLTRRIVLSAAVVGLAVLTALGGGDGVAAETEHRPGHGDKSIFQSSCEQYGGAFLDSPKDKLTACFYPDKSKTVCDSNGNDCINYPPPKPTKLERPLVGSAGEIIEILPMEPAPTVVETQIGGRAVLADSHVIADEADASVAASITAPAEGATAAPGDESVAEPGSAPVADQGAAPVAEAVEESVVEPVTAPVAQPVEEPAAAPVEAVEEPATVPVEEGAEPIDEPIAAVEEPVVPIEEPVAAEEPMAAEASEEQP